MLDDWSPDEAHRWRSVWHTLGDQKLAAAALGVTVYRLQRWMFQLESWEWRRARALAAMRADDV